MVLLHTHTETVPRGSVTITALVIASYDVSKPMSSSVMS